MGSEVISKGIDGSVGGLVWVRRRNGTWWPGRIMGLDELSENCLVSPKSGTPVKLLGREDASVDWYNLEKSKRVKAFRCGEYDECIQKAKASAANPNKKAVRYARREDAILHALEIESSRKSNQKYEGISTQELSQSSLSFDFEDPNLISTTKEEFMSKKRQKISNDSENDGAEGTERMKGLEDLGIAVASKRKSDKNLIIEGSHELLQPDYASLSEFDIGNGSSNGTPLISSKFSSSTFKRSQSHVTNFHESMKRKNRRRTLAKVLKNTPILSVPVSCDRVATGPGGSSLQGVTGTKVSAEPKKTNGSLVLKNNLDRSKTSCTKETSPSTSEQTSDTGADAADIPSEMKEKELTIMSEFPENDCSDGLYDVPFDGERKKAKAFTSGAVGKLSSHCSQVGSVSLNSEELDESGSTNVVRVDNVVRGEDKDTSKWQLKGKRNLRSLSNRLSRKIYSMRSIDGHESLILDNCTQVTEFGDTGYESQHLRNQRSRRESKFNSLAHENSVAKSTTHIRNKGFCLTNSMTVLSQRSLSHRPSRFTTSSRYHVDDASNKYESYSSLFAVNLEVQASYPDQHVPLVSLMSKLNGKAIVGHPLTVHVLDDGYCDLLMGNIRSRPTSRNHIEQPMYHTNSSLLLDNRSKAVPVKHATVHSISSPRKSRKIKKSLASRKIRRLSSLATSHKKKEEKRKPLVEKSGGPITCVPLKVVFSRINEGMNRSA